jgi:hypothetical protein
MRMPAAVEREPEVPVSKRSGRCQGKKPRRRSDPVGGVMAVALGRTVNCVAEDEPSARRWHAGPDCRGPSCYWIGPA